MAISTLTKRLTLDEIESLREKYFIGREEFSLARERFLGPDYEVIKHCFSRPGLKQPEIGVYCDTIKDFILAQKVIPSDDKNIFFLVPEELKQHAEFLKEEKEMIRKYNEMEHKFINMKDALMKNYKGKYVCIDATGKIFGAFGANEDRMRLYEQMYKQHGEIQIYINKVEEESFEKREPEFI